MLKKAEKILIGRHCGVRSPHYLVGAVAEALALGATTLTFFLGSPRSSRLPGATELRAEEFRQKLKENGWDINKIVVHGPYIVNLANSSNPKVFNLSVSILTRQITLMREIGLSTLVIHPGSSLDNPHEEGLRQVVKGLDKIFEACPEGRVALETTAKRNKVGGRLEDLLYIIQNVKQTERVGVCWDTCHLFAAGYDLKDGFADFLEEFKKKIGLEKLWAIHINDSQGALGSGVDVHRAVGQGELGLEAIRRVVKHPELSLIPKLLETPRSNIVNKEIEILKS